MALATFWVSLVAPAARGAEPAVPAVERVTAEGLHSQPALGSASYFALDGFGYVEEEYFLSGTTRSTRSPTQLPGPAPPLPDSPYTTRAIVRRPADAARFDGTVVVEWLNVTAGHDGDTLWLWAHEHFLSQGAVYVGMSAQLVGVTTLRTVDPVRYAPLNHPGDSFAFDIFSQALAAAKTGRLTGGAMPARVIASGFSQSGFLLQQYIDSGAGTEAGVVDGYLLDAGGAVPFAQTSPDVPTLNFLSEEVTTTIFTSSGTQLHGGWNGGPNYRTWWVPGAAHTDHWSLAGFEERAAAYAADDAAARWDPVAHGGYGERGEAGGPVCGVYPNTFPRRYALKAALTALETWIRDGVPARDSDPFAYEEDGQLRRDLHGNTEGGVRSPVLEVPVAEYNGTQCDVAGYTVPFDDAKLHALYPTHGAYVDRLSASADQAVARGEMLPRDRADLMKRACAAGPRWPETAAACVSGAIGTLEPTPAAVGPLGTHPATGGTDRAGLAGAMLLSAVLVRRLVATRPTGGRRISQAP